MPAPLSVSIQRHLFDPRTTSWPVDWAAVFGREAPLALEIGFGNGQFLLEQALARPDRDHVGLERSWAGATRLFKRLDKHGVTNVRAVLGDADVALEHFFRRESLDEVWVNHPCPWPKERHHERRLLQPEGLRRVADRLRLGHPLTVVTDHAAYASWVAERLEAEPALASRHATTEVAAIPGRRPTKYQQKAMDQGVPIHFFEWEKRSPVPSEEPPLPDSLDPMPSLNLRGALAAQPLFDGFAAHTLRESHRDVDIVVKLSAAYARTDRPGEWLVEALVREDKLKQDFCVLVLERSGEELLVKLSGLGRPHPTRGVRRAVQAVGQWLARRHPGLAVVHHNLGEVAAHPLEPEREPG